MKGWALVYIEFLLKHAQPMTELPVGYGVYSVY